MEHSAFFSCALLLAEDEALVSLDKTLLRQAGIPRLRLASSGRAALAALKNSAGEQQKGFAASGLIIWHGLADMSLAAFVKAFREECPHLNPPLLILGAPDQTLAEAVAGPLAFLPRPYTQIQLGRVLRDLRRGTAALAGQGPACLPGLSFGKSIALPRTDKHVRERLPDQQTVGAGQAAEQENPADKHLKQGLNFLRNLRLKEAQAELETALILDPQRLETLLALARLHQQRQEEPSAAGCLLRAVKAYLERGETEKAGLVFARVPRRYVTENPFVPVAEKLLLAGQYKEAISAFLEARKADPQSELHSLMGRACQFTKAPEESLRQLCIALARAGQAESAGHIWRRMVPASQPRQDGPPNVPTWMTRFPRLNEIMQVASYTLQAWRSAA